MALLLSRLAPKRPWPFTYLRHFTYHLTSRTTSASHHLTTTTTTTTSPHHHLTTGLWPTTLRVLGMTLNCPAAPRPSISTCRVFSRPPSPAHRPLQFPSSPPHSFCRLGWLFFQTAPSHSLVFSTLLRRPSNMLSDLAGFSFFSPCHTRRPLQLLYAALPSGFGNSRIFSRIRPSQQLAFFASHSPLLHLVFRSGRLFLLSALSHSPALFTPPPNSVAFPHHPYHPQLQPQLRCLYISSTLIQPPTHSFPCTAASAASHSLNHAPLYISITLTQHFTAVYQHHAH